MAVTAGRPVLPIILLPTLYFLLSLKSWRCEIREFAVPPSIRTHSSVFIWTVGNHRLLFYLELIPPTQWTKEIAVNQVQKTPLQAVETSYSVLLNIVPVVVRANGKEIPTFALLDWGSEASLLNKKISEALNITHRPAAIKLSTFHGQDPNFDLALVSFDIVATDRSVSFGVKDTLLVPWIKFMSYLTRVTA